MRKTLLLGAAVCWLATPAFALTDKEFLTFAIQGDNSESMIGLLAGAKGGTAQVRSDGKIIAGDHDKARIEAVKLADARGMKWPTSPSPEAQAEAKTLKTLSGAAFDREFADFLVKSHDKAIAEYRKEVASSDQAVAKYARMTIPTLEKHLRMGETLLKNAGVAKTQ